MTNGQGWIPWDWTIGVLSFVAMLMHLACLRAPEVFDSPLAAAGRLFSILGFSILAIRLFWVLGSGGDPPIAPWSLLGLTLISLASICINVSKLFLLREGNDFRPVVAPSTKQ